MVITLGPTATVSSFTLLLADPVAVYSMDDSGDIANSTGSSSVVMTTAAGEPPMALVAMIDAPDVIGPCTDLVLDASATVIPGNRPPTTIEWSAVVTSFPSIGIGSPLETAEGLGTLKVTIPHQDLSTSTYAFTLKITDWLGRAANATVSVRVSALPAPLIALRTPATVASVVRSRGMRLRASASVALDCSDIAVAGYTITYAWSQTAGQSIGNSPTGTALDAVAAQTDTRSFTILPHAFPPPPLTGSHGPYEFTVTAAMLASATLRSSATVRVLKVVLAPVVAAIRGGSGPLTAPVDESLKLSGKGSSDPEKAPYGLPTSHTWACAYQSAGEWAGLT